MDATYFGLLAIAGYLAASASLVHTLRQDYIASPPTYRLKLAVFALGALAGTFHGATLLDMCDRNGTVNFSFLSTSSLAALVIVVILLITTLIKPVDKLGVIVFPIASLLVLLKMVLPEESHPLKNYSWQMDVHILASMLAYSFLNIAALQAVVLAWQDWQLRSHHTSGWVRSFPPLQTMEKLLFQLIGAGFVLLSVSLLSGFVFLEDIFAQHLAHKTVLSIAAWLIFALVLGGRIRQGWRGQIAIRWTLGGFAALMLAYFGSKIVLEWVLKRV